MRTIFQKLTLGAPADSSLSFVPGERTVAEKGEEIDTKIVSIAQCIENCDRHLAEIHVPWSKNIVIRLLYSLKPQTNLTCKGCELRESFIYFIFFLQEWVRWQAHNLKYVRRLKLSGRPRSESVHVIACVLSLRSFATAHPKHAINGNNKKCHSLKITHA